MELEGFEVDLDELKYSEKEILNVYKQTLMLQKEKVNSLTIYDEDYKKGVRTSDENGGRLQTSEA